MNRDEYGLVYLDQDQICEFLYQRPNFDLSKILVKDAQKFNHSNKILYAGYPNLTEYQAPDSSREEFDRVRQQTWFLPQNYIDMDIESWLLSQCTTPEQIHRVQQELELFRKTNLLILVKYLKYLIDVMTKENILWGVGRGSSSASYVLYLIGLHKVDCIKYQIPIDEFFKQGDTDV